MPRHGHAKLLLGPVLSHRLTPLICAVLCSLFLSRRCDGERTGQEVTEDTEEILRSTGSQAGRQQARSAAIGMGVTVLHPVL